MGDNCINCPENNPPQSRVSLRMDNIEKWQAQHDEKLIEREAHRERDKRSIITSITIAVILMIITSIYNTLIARIDNGKIDNVYQKKRNYTHVEHSNGDRGDYSSDTSNSEVR